MARRPVDAYEIDPPFGRWALTLYTRHGWRDTLRVQIFAGQWDSARPGAESVNRSRCLGAHVVYAGSMEGSHGIATRYGRDGNGAASGEASGAPRIDRGSALSVLVRWRIMKGYRGPHNTQQMRTHTTDSDPKVPVPVKIPPPPPPRNNMFRAGASVTIKAEVKVVLRPSLCSVFRNPRTRGLRAESANLLHALHGPCTGTA